MYKQLIDATNKIKKVIELIKKKPLSAIELDDVLIFIVQMIDDWLLNNDAIVYRLSKNIIKNGRILDLQLKPTDEPLPTKETHEFLYLFKTLLALLISKKVFFNFYIFNEINMIINYYITASIKDKSYDSLNHRFKINEQEYHNQVVMYKYLYSIFDKLLYSSAFIVHKYQLSTLELEQKFIFTKDFPTIAQPFFKSLVKKTNTTTFLNSFDKALAFHFVRKLRNNLEHSFSDPKAEYNIALETELLFILIVRCLIQIHTDFRSDTQLLKLLK